MNIIKGLKGVAGSIRSAYKRFPIPLILAALSGILLIMLNELSWSGKDIEEDISRLVMVLMLGVPITLGLKLLWERLDTVKIVLKLSAYAAAAVFLILYYFLMIKDFEMVPVLRYILISGMFYLISACITCWFDGRNYEMYIIKVFTRFLITGIFALVMFGGIAGVLASIDGLLEVNVPSKAYLYTFYIIATFFVPSYAFAGIPQSYKELDDAKYPKSLSVLLLYIMIPIVCAYTVILYLYFIKVLIEWTLPKGMVGNLVLWYSIVSIIVIFFIAPVIQEKKWVKGFVFWFTKLILPCIVMLFIAVGIRINAYGVTESRYFVVLTGLWAFGIFIYWNISGVRRNIILPASLAVLLIISSGGPFSAFNISIRSQSNRLKEIVQNYGMLEGGVLKPAKDTISQKDRGNIRSILTYFDGNHSLSDVSFLPSGFKIEDMSEYFGFNLYEYSDGTTYFNFTSEKVNAVDISAYDYLVSLELGGVNGEKVKFGNSYIAEYSKYNQAIEVYENNEKIYSFDLKGFVEKIREGYGEDKYEIDQKDMTIEDENSHFAIRIMFTNLSGTMDTSLGATDVQSLSGSVFVRIK